MPGLLDLKAPPLASDFLQPPVSSACLACACEGVKLRLRLLSPRGLLLGQLGQTPAPPLLCDVQHLADNRHPLEEGIGSAGVQSDLHLIHFLACLLSEHGRRQRLQQQNLCPSHRLEPAATARRGVAPRVPRQGLLCSARLDALADLVPAGIERIAHPEHHHPLATGERRVTGSDRPERAHGHRVLVALTGPPLPELVGERLVLWVVHPRHRLELDLGRELDERSPAVGRVRVLVRADLQGTSVRRPVGSDGDCRNARVDHAREGDAQLEAIGRTAPQHGGTHDEHSLLAARLRKQGRRRLSLDRSPIRGARE